MKSSKDVVEKRQKNILQALQKCKSADVTELAGQFHVTTATIRRDLQYLEDKGYVRRFFGGVEYILPQNTDVQYQTPKGNPTPSRIAIARCAASMIEDGDVILLNSSSTALYILDYLPDIHAVFVTNNGRALYAKRNVRIELFLTGGEIYGNKQSLVGDMAVNTLKMVTATKCFLGASGVSASGGVTSSILQESSVNRQMIRQCAGPKIIVADSSKIGVQQSFFSYGLDGITHLITDSGADPAELDRIRALGVEVILADR